MATYFCGYFLLLSNSSSIWQRENGSFAAKSDSGAVCSCRLRGCENLDSRADRICFGFSQLHTRPSLCVKSSSLVDSSQAWLYCLYVGFVPAYASRSPPEPRGILSIVRYTFAHVRASTKTFKKRGALCVYTLVALVQKCVKRTLYHKPLRKSDFRSAHATVPCESPILPIS